MKHNQRRIQIQYILVIIQILLLACHTPEKEVSYSSSDFHSCLGKDWILLNSWNDDTVRFKSFEGTNVHGEVAVYSFEKDGSIVFHMKDSSGEVDHAANFPDLAEARWDMRESLLYIHLKAVAGGAELYALKDAYLPVKTTGSILELKRMDSIQTDRLKPH